MYFQCRKYNFGKAEVKVAGGVFSRTNDHLKMEINKKSGRKGLQRLNTAQVIWNKSVVKKLQTYRLFGQRG